ncbi:inner membrane-spanning protein YciB [Brevundimonas pondensis]|uniref:Inner membrane-spanning protein YciB n=1 Tax=Brevundimonas pondensis TaxID=2774189 RepID=A0ABX7SIS9_9CAUL|nr:septation protein IspZ [Brevundimonas pondensis]QTC87612.1 septation protein IspZ [Brevundimonas pondensis]
MSEATDTKRPQWIRQAVDFGALIAFMAAYFITRDMIKATWVLVIASAIALAVGFVLERRLAPMPLITGGFALVFGALTILTDDDLFVKLKLTVQNGLLAAVLLGSLPLNKSPFKALLGSAIKVTDAAWRTLTLRYGLYFLAVAIANEVFRSPAAVTAIWSALNLGAPDPNGVWTAFRGVLWIAASIFGLCQVPLIMKNMIKDEEPGPISPDTGL